MEKKLVLVKEGNNGHTKMLPDVFAVNGWKLETFDLSEGKSLSKSLDNFDGLFILSKSINVLEKSAWPLTVYMGA
jgi:hypothetical protein